MEKTIQHQPLSFMKHLFLTVLFFGISNIPLTVYLILNTDKEPFTLAENGFLLASILFSVFVPLFFLTKKKVLSFTSSWLTKENLVLIVGGYLSILLLHYGLTFLGLSGTSNGRMIEESMNGNNTILLLVLVSLVAPILEECVYRGCIIGLMFRHYPVVGVLVSSIVFSFAHVPSDGLSFINYFIPGLIFGFIYVKSKRLEVSIALHLFNNIVALAMVLLGFG
ncbi:CAAX amino protease [Enterococcus florum]|uniref:CAAX amino protease n=1 Tax=Enterococcus florum TaxID=2480627 RepID=A0A4P5PSV6_9ENTE|nr:type II CAAX endopeptidase family protein [Enterococcus florum]GCF95673.1 CAAX amino protease [Enterococcus florum]